MNAPEPDRLRQPSVGGSATFLLSSMFIGIFWFVALITLVSVGVPTLICWIGVPICLFAMIFWRGGANLERARVYALLDTWITVPYRDLAETGTARWKARLTEAATWRDFAYLILLMPLGIIEFVLVTTFWAVALGAIALPIYFRWLPDGAYYFPAWDLRWISVDSTLDALPWCAAGLLVLFALVVPLTKGLGRLHARYSLALLGPTRQRRQQLNLATNGTAGLGAVAG